MQSSDLHQIPTAQRDTKAFQVTPAFTNFGETSLFQVSWRHHTDNWALGSCENCQPRVQQRLPGRHPGPLFQSRLTSAFTQGSSWEQTWRVDTGDLREGGCIWFRHPSFRQELLHWPQQTQSSFKKMTKMSWKFSVLFLSACTLGRRLMWVKWVQNVHSVWAGSNNHFNYQKKSGVMVKGGETSVIMNLINKFFKTQL